jgi:predicted RNase H-like HicB family nuclease
MTYDVLLTKGANNRYTARALLLPDLVASGANEAEALERLRAAIAEVQANSRIVRLDVPSPPETSSDAWLRFAGVWKHDPDWDLFQSEIEAYRQAIDLQTTTD